MKSFIGLAVMMAVLVVQMKAEVLEQKFDIDMLHAAIERCGPSEIVGHCGCGPNTLRWIKCLSDDLGLLEEHCPKTNECVNLARITELFTFYSSNAKKNCECNRLQ